VDASKKIFMAIRNLVFDLELFIGERDRKERLLLDLCYIGD
jgi:hypothetical protein